MKLSVDGCSRDNHGISTTSGVLRDHWGSVLAAFGFFLGHQLTLFAEVAIVCEGLDFGVQLGYFDNKVEFNSTTIISWITSYGSI